MRYNSRCTITTKEKESGYLGEDEVLHHTRLVACYQSNLSSEEQIDLFGKYAKTAFKLHLQGIVKDIDQIEFEGVRRNIFDIHYHRNSTVVVIA